MPQFTFTSTDTFVKGEVQAIADREMRSLSEMIDILLRQAVKERYRKRINTLAKKDIHTLRDTSSGMET